MDVIFTKTSKICIKNYYIRRQVQLTNPWKSLIGRAQCPRLTPQLLQRLARLGGTCLDPRQLHAGGLVRVPDLVLYIIHYYYI